MKILEIDENYLKDHNSYETAVEICSQPDKWKMLYEDYLKKEKEILAIRKEDKEIGKYWDIIVMEEHREEKYGNNEKIKRKISRK